MSDIQLPPLIETIRRAVNCSEITKSLAEEIVSYLQSKEVTAEPVALAEAQKDAERYQRVRSKKQLMFKVVMAHQPPIQVWEEELDKYVDYEIAASKEGK